jgi:uncharacterized protein
MIARVQAAFIQARSSLRTFAGITLVGRSPFYTYSPPFFFMTKAVDLKRLNVPQLAQNNAHLQGVLPLAAFHRLAPGMQASSWAGPVEEKGEGAEVAAEVAAVDALEGEQALVHWTMAFFESVLPPLNPKAPLVVSSPHVPPMSKLLAHELPTLALGALARVSLVCQRCLAPLEVVLDVQRQFYLVTNEDTATALDEVMEDDLLVSSSAFDGQDLIEDELILAMPLVPMHEVCSVALPQHLGPTADDEMLSKRPNPFAVLSGLKLKKD